MADTAGGTPTPEDWTILFFAESFSIKDEALECGSLLPALRSRGLATVFRCLAEASLCPLKRRQAAALQSQASHDIKTMGLRI